MTGLLLFLVLARLWGPADFGRFTFVFSLTAIFALIVDFGFTNFLLREVGAQPGSAAGLIQQTFWAKLRLVPVYVFGAVAVLVALGGHAAPLGVAVPLLLAALLLSFAEFFIAPMRALGRFGTEATVAGATNLFHFVATAAVAWSGGSLEMVAWTFVASRFAFSVLAFLLLMRLVPGVTFSPPAQHARGLLRRALPYGVDGALTTLWSQLDIVVVRLLFGAQTAGLYAGGQRLVQGALSVAPVAGNVLIPKMARLAHLSDPTFHTVAKRGVLVLGLVGTAFAFPLLLVPTYLTELLFGAAYSDLAWLLPYFGAFLIIRFVAAGLGIVITSAGLQKERVFGQVLALIFFGSSMLLIVRLHLDVTWFLIIFILSYFVLGGAYALYWRGMARKR